MLLLRLAFLLASLWQRCFLCSLERCEAPTSKCVCAVGKEMFSTPFSTREDRPLASVSHQARPSLSRVVQSSAVCL